MAEQRVQPEGAPPAGEPIFADLDIPCPHCEYNLRGLIEPRCPECGEIFDPYKVLHDFRETQPPLPIFWVIRNVYRHPLEFWRLQQVRRSRGPTRVQLFSALLYLPTLLAWTYLELAGAPATAPAELLVRRIIQGVFMGLFVSLVPYMFVLIHGFLCRAGLLRSPARQGVRAAKEVVGYGLVWFGPVLLGTIIAGRHFRSLFAVGANVLDQIIAAAAICAVAACCFAWAVTLYQGAKFVSGDSCAVAVWCTLANPFWYILLLVALLALR